jgi:hypothetical protein
MRSLTTSQGGIRLRLVEQCKTGEVHFSSIRRNDDTIIVH